eukprot:TRINITY_DN2800_c1_g1_i1.p1 TRINITY_DN2800_c1_g1~~TRINITY_DN2800_c1_g1_i1.p1  ORF type:complete len:191 (-),score=56.56 TRINITY_DN2800_c1_g1_i1:20-592(-)
MMHVHLLLLALHAQASRDSELESSYAVQQSHAFQAAGMYRKRQATEAALETHSLAASERHGGRSTSAMRHVPECNVESNDPEKILAALRKCLAARQALAEESVKLLGEEQRASKKYVGDVNVIMEVINTARSADHLQKPWSTDQRSAVTQLLKKVEGMEEVANTLWSEGTEKKHQEAQGGEAEEDEPEES